jgi:hypothetical protein
MYVVKVLQLCLVWIQYIKWVNLEFIISNPASSDYLENRVDLNNNSIPDYIENIAIQADTTLKAFTYLGFISPLESDRYKNVAEYIDIHVNLSSGNGLAYKGVTNYINKANKKNKCTLIIQIRKNLEAFQVIGLR